eukprot:TRINITY_DN7537_c0_g1_i1.p1 TRINITY_DN7537_c0_g1~~TRINITY_DN7537_c0_g1_i1.p1  ORF type:complete len:703 (-),score=91.55 TRINITY_DN7537_c0_g1_i1:246-2300(-)
MALPQSQTMPPFTVDGSSALDDETLRALCETVSMAVTGHGTEPSTLKVLPGIEQQNQYLGMASVVSLSLFGLVVISFSRRPLLRGNSGIILLTSLAVGAVFNLVSIKEWLEPVSRPCGLYTWLELFSMFGSPLYFVALTVLLLRTARSPFSTDAGWPYHVSAVASAAALATWMYEYRGGRELDVALDGDEPCEHLFLRHWTTYKVGRAFYVLGVCIFSRAWCYMRVALSSESKFSERRKTVIRALKVVLLIQAFFHIALPSVVIITGLRLHLPLVAFYTECFLNGLSVAIPSAAWLGVFLYSRRHSDKLASYHEISKHEISEAVREQLMWLVARGICQSARQVANEHGKLPLYEDCDQDVVVDDQCYTVSAMAPRAFAEVRSIFGIGTEDEDGYVKSIETPAQEKFTEGKSGAFMYYTLNNRFIIKTTTKEEFCVLRKLLPSYLEHLRQNPDTLINPMIGAYELKFYNHPVRVIVVQSVFHDAPPGFRPQERYDLKGSWVGRGPKKPSKKGLPWKSRDGFGFSGVRKDLDVKGPFLIDKQAGAALADALRRDSRFLARHSIMDYSLLVGVSKSMHAVNTSAKPLSGRLSAVRANRVVGPDIYCMGVIDVLQKFNFRKKCEHVLKRYLLRKGPGISCVPAGEYARRFRQNIVGPLVCGDDAGPESEDDSWTSDESDSAEELEALE